MDRQNLNRTAATLTRTIVETPIGPMLALASDRALCALEFWSRSRMPRLDARLERWFAPFSIEDGSNGVIERVRRWLNDYFNGVSASIDGLPLDMRGAAFERRVWEALREIPPGLTTTYGAIARQLGAPGSSRAVGLANGANPIAIVVPCHRVIGSNGTLTGYGGGLDRKQWLIDHERRWRSDALPFNHSMNALNARAR
jgi:AraC family transcriptional regulator of adaptative response/methylated-DNA-[protein]-cysteine methyltransferase